MTAKEIQTQYNKERGRIKRLKTNLEKQGYIFPNENILPAIPKRVTEGSIRKLQRISQGTVARKGLYVKSETGETITGRTQYAKTHKPKGKKHKTKKTPKQKAKKTRSDYYKNSGKKSGTKTPPTKVEETVFNTYEELSYERISSDDLYYVDENGYGTESVDTQNYQDFITRLNNWEPNHTWSKSLINIKNRDVNKAARIISDAVKRYGLAQVAKNINDNATEVSDILYTAMYMGSGSDFIEGRNTVQRDLQRLEEILRGETLTLDEAQEFADNMEEWEFEDYFE